MSVFYNFVLHIKNFFLKNKRIALSLVIFFAVIFLLGIPFVHWGFLHDDFGAVFYSKIKSWRDFINFFLQDARVCLWPSNYDLGQATFFNVYYRPLVNVFYFFQCYLFNFSAYAFLLTMVLLHAINSVILFNVFLWFVDYAWAFWAAMFFAFNPSLCEWMGWVAGQGHVLNFLLILLVLLFLKKYLDSKKLSFYLISYFVFLLSLFTRETAVILPVWLFWAIYLYLDSQNKISGGFFKNFKKIFYTTFGFCIITLFYFLLRLYFYPPVFGHSQIELNPLQFLINLKNRFFDLVTFAADLFGLCYMPGGHRLLKGIFIITFSLIFIWAFIKNRRKNYVLFFAVSMFMIMWPSILRYYSSRYLYKALPFYILIILFLINFYNYSSQESKLKWKRISLWLAYITLCLNIILLTLWMHKRETFLHKLSVAFDELAQNSQVQNRKICFVGLPWSIFPTGAAQAVWMRGITLPIYYDRRTWGFSNTNIPQNYLEIQPIKDGFRLFSKNPEKIWIAAWGQEEFAMGKLTANATQYGQVVDASLIFDTKYLQQNLVFVVWDYAEMKFKILPNPL